MTVTDVVATAGRAQRGHYGEPAPFVIVRDTPGGNLAVPVGSARAAALAARYITEYCPHIRASWQVNPQAGLGPVVVFGCARPPAGQHLLNQHAHAFLLAAGDALPRVWVAWCGHEIENTQFEVLGWGMGHPCPGCHQRWAAAHHQDTGLPVRSPGQHRQLRRRPVADRWHEDHPPDPDRPPVERVPRVSSRRPVGRHRAASR